MDRQPSLFDPPAPLDGRAAAQRRSVASRRAAAKVQSAGVIGPRMAAILRALRAAQPGTLISSEIAAITGFMRQSLTSPLANLRTRGFIVAGDLRPGPHGAEQTSFRITGAGLEQLRAFEQAPARPARRPR